MDKSVIFAVAGSGKTTRIIESLTEDRRYLILTFTDNNLANLKCKIIKKFGYMPHGIGVFSYFSFLHSFCYRPFFAMEMKTKGFNWDPPPKWTSSISREKDAYYVDGSHRLYYGRLALFLENRKMLGDIIERIEKYFDVLMVDEVQDFAGHDFNFLDRIVKRITIDVLLVGDFYQHTFDTSRDGPTNRTLHDSYVKYRKRFAEMGVKIDDTSLVKSRRCAPATCTFVRDKLGIEMEADGKLESNIELVTEQKKVDELFECEETVKLFYQEHSKYVCLSQNWGGSKGLDHYYDVCVVLNAPLLKAYKKNDFSEIKAKTRNKFYVACTRARRHLFFVPETLLKKYKLNM